MCPCSASGTVEVRGGDEWIFMGKASTFRGLEMSVEDIRVRGGTHWQMMKLKLFIKVSLVLSSLCSESWILDGSCELRGFLHGLPIWLCFISFVGINLSRFEVNP